MWLIFLMNCCWWAIGVVYMWVEGGLVAEVPILPAHGALLSNLLCCQPLQDAVHVETMPALSSHCREQENNVVK